MPPAILRPELFQLLARGHGARVTVLTPNRRLAQSLRRDYDRLQQARGLQAWETADILPFGAFVQRLWEDALYSELATSIPMLLTAPQEQALWDEAIRAARIPDAVFSAESAAAQCREAWQIAHAWRIDPRVAGTPNEDTRAYRDWSARYERATRENGQTDGARLADVVGPLLENPALRKPATLALAGFDIVTPQMLEFFERLAAQGCETFDAPAPAQEAKVARVELTDARAEIAAAARWARTRLEADPKARIGVVVPDLVRARTQIHRLFADAMRPDHLLAPGEGSFPFNISLGAPLADRPLVGDALLALAFSGPGIAFEQASRLVRSPFIAGAQAERDVRALLDSRLRERCGPSVTLDAVLRVATGSRAPRAPLLLERLSRLAEYRKSDLFGAKTASQWALAFSEALRALGFPGDRALDSAEYQALDSWHELLAQFAALERVTAKMGHGEACRRLARMAREAIFQPQATDVPVQVLGILESAGLQFDHLWVMGLTDEAWPFPARPNPFIAVRLQRGAGIPQADAGSSLELDRRITAGWLAAAREVVVSHGRMRGESELAPSPLIGGCPSAEIEALGIGAYPLLRDAIRAAGLVEVIDDARAPRLESGARSGGTTLFRDQAACPFRAFARHRLGSDPLEAPVPGLDARDRGTLVHEMLALVWKSLESRERLAAAAAAQLEELLGACADQAIAKVKRYRSDVLAGRFGALERERLVRLAREWLAVEVRRPDFEVVAIEDKRPVTFGGIIVNARLDRMDHLAAGGRMIIDYTTGDCAPSGWMGARPDEPQLPMYALAGADDVAAVAFGQVKTGQMGLRGIGRASDLVAGVKLITKDQSRAARQYHDWDDLLRGWRTELDALGVAFLAGDARVDPKDGEATCENCHQQMFCRIAERAPFDATAGSESDE